MASQDRRLVLDARVYLFTAVQIAVTAIIVLIIVSITITLSSI